jgi:hypothetical protein
LIDYNNLDEKRIRKIIQSRIDKVFDILTIGDPSPALLPISLSLGEKQVETFFSVRILEKGYQLPLTMNITMEDYKNFLRQQKLERILNY